MSMSLKSNGLLKILVPAVLVIVVLIVVMSGGKGSGRQAQQQVDASLQLTSEELELLGVEADTPQDTVATLVGRVRLMEQDLQNTRSESRRLVEQNSKLAEQNANVDRRLEEVLRQERRRMQEEEQRKEQSLLARFERQFEQLKNNYTSDAESASGGEMPIGTGRNDSHQYTPAPSTVWVTPMDGVQEQKGRNQGEWSFPTAFADGVDVVADSVVRGATAAEAKVTGKPDASLVQPVYTVPANATLMGSLGMTALIGRVPVNGTVSDPYPFKVVIGKDNLTANHIEIPEVHSAIVSGTATGDWTLSCVRGSITSMTFVFEDGTIRTVPQPETGNTRQSRSNDEVLGYISDPYGIPCVSGIRRSNAKEYLSSRALITAAGAAVASSLVDDSEGVATINTDGSVSSAITGNQAVTSVLTNGISDISDWVNRLYGEAFAAVYVQPGVEVAVHIERPLEIDYEQAGRKVRHGSTARVSYELP
uniref:TIGR03752 family integrating conjugative element protein n=1 Tax=Halopseudomonas xiamenensis TaxID=157792 RepID=UPI0038B29F57